jgi:hypothetical protein
MTLRWIVEVRVVDQENGAVQGVSFYEIPEESAGLTDLERQRVRIIATSAIQTIEAYLHEKHLVDVP